MLCSYVTVRASNFFLWAKHFDGMSACNPAGPVKRESQYDELCGLRENAFAGTKYFAPPPKKNTECVETLKTQHLNINSRFIEYFNLQCPKYAV